MKTDTRLLYLERLQAVLDYLYLHLDSPLNLDTLADVGCFSPCHFHRIYHAMLGETVAETVKRLRLHHAAGALIRTNVSLQRIAQQTGYGSQAAFTRAFRDAYGKTPGEYRTTSPSSIFLNDDLSGDIDMNAVAETMNPVLSVNITEQKPIAVIARRHLGDYMEIGREFDQLTLWATAHQLLNQHTRWFGVYYQDPAATPKNELVADACINVSDDVAGDEKNRREVLAGGRYAVVEHIGSYAELERTYAWLYGEWLPRSGEEPRNAPCIEEYLNDVRTTPASELRTAIWLPLK
jgi:AraC family transcriptional regulator